MRRQAPRVVDPREAHSRVARTQYGAASTKQVQADLADGLAALRTASGVTPRVTGQTVSDIQQSLIAALVRLGLIVDETTGPDVEGL